MTDDKPHNGIVSEEDMRNIMSLTGEELEKELERRGMSLEEIMQANIESIFGIPEAVYGCPVVDYQPGYGGIGFLTPLPDDALFAEDGKAENDK